MVHQIPATISQQPDATKQNPVEGCEVEVLNGVHDAGDVVEPTGKGKAEPLVLGDAEDSQEEANVDNTPDGHPKSPIDGAKDMDDPSHKKPDTNITDGGIDHMYTNIC